MNFIDSLLDKVCKIVRDDPDVNAVIQKLVSHDNTTFGEGLAEVLAIPESNPLQLYILREAIRFRSGKREVQFYETFVGGLTVRNGEEVLTARDRILCLAKEKALLSDPKVSGNLIAAFTLIGGFEGVVELLHEIREVAGLDQFHAFQLLYNQNRSAVCLKTSHGIRD